MKILFTVQGEGRGHLTQAMAMQQMLTRQGHHVVSVLLGSDGSREVPDYFTAAFEVPVRSMLSPGLTFRCTGGVSALATLGAVLSAAPGYRRSLGLLQDEIRRTEPDLIVNFLEPIMGLYNVLRRPQVPTLVVGHQYMLEHPACARVQKFHWQQQGMRAYIRLVGARAARLALSFYPAADLPNKRVTVCPPLLRQPLFELEPTTGNYLLVYLLNHGYAEAILRWHSLHPHITVHCFYDRPGAPAEDAVRPGLTFHRLHGEKFLRLMAGCRAVVCTAGVESVSEAAYLGKPLLMVPVENHVEQYLNACDAERAGLGIRDEGFRISRVLDPRVTGAPPAFRRWVDRAEAIAVRAAETAAGNQPAVPAPLDVGAMPRPTTA